MICVIRGLNERISAKRHYTVKKKIHKLKFIRELGQMISQALCQRKNSHTSPSIYLNRFVLK